MSNRTTKATSVLLLLVWGPAAVAQRGPTPATQEEQLTRAEFLLVGDVAPVPQRPATGEPPPACCLAGGAAAAAPQLLLPTPRPAGAHAGRVDQQSPIRMHFDLHADPLPNDAPLSVKQGLYNDWCAWVSWVLDQTEPLGVQIAFLSGGQWMELTVADGTAGVGAEVLRRIYHSGGQIGSHSHWEQWQGQPFNWPSLNPTTATLAQSQDLWQDAADWVDQGILTAFAGAPPEPLADIHCVRGSHAPGNEPDFHALMQQFAYRIRQPGPEEDYYGWYGHHIWHPFRPSAQNPMGEDLNAPFVSVTQGSVIGLAQVHHGVFQDMTAPAIKRQFLQLYVNWRFRDRTGAGDKVWCWGWGSHASDFNPGSPSRTALLDVLPWLEQHFAHKVEPSGSKVLEWSTHRATGAAYFAWEAAHPATSSFSFNSLAVNWQEYPWLRPVAEELAGFGWTADLALASGTHAFLLDHGTSGTQAALLWRDTGNSIEDLSAHFSGAVRVLGLETGALLGTNPSSVAVAQEPVWVVEDLTCAQPTSYCATSPNSAGSGALMGFSGSTSIALDDFVLQVSGAPPYRPGLFYYGPNPANLPFGDGRRCVGGPSFRLPLDIVSPSGTVGRKVSLKTPPGPPNLFLAGATLHWQFWYRDPTGGPVGFNLSNGLRSTFCP